MTNAPDWPVLLFIAAIACMFAPTCIAINAILLRWYAGNNPIAIEAAATVAARDVTADERAWESELRG